MWVSVAVGGATALIGANAAKQSANAQADSAQDQLDMAEKIRRQNLQLGRATFRGQTGVYNDTLDRQTGVARDMYEDQRRVAGDYLGRSSASTASTLDSQLGLFDPFYRTGRSANNALAVEFGLRPGESQFRTSPGYDFRMNEGIGAVEGSAAAAGGLMSGATMDAVNYTAQGIADQEHDDYLAGLFGLSGQGMSAGGAMAGAYGQANADRQNSYANVANMQTNAATGLGNNLFGAYGQYGANMGNAFGNTFNALAGTNSQFGADAANAYANQGDARAAGYMGVNNALMGGIQNGLGLWNYNNQTQTPGATNPWAMPPTYFGGGR